MNSNSHSTLNILIAGGGSGGHLAPAIGIAEQLTHRHHRVLLGHSGRDIDYQMIRGTPFDEVVLPAKPLLFSPRGVFNFGRGFRDAVKKTKSIIKEHSIDGVVSTGGFVAAPALFAAKQLRIPSLLLNLDSPPGKANALARRWATTLVSTVPCSWNDAVIVQPPLRNASAERVAKTEAALALGLSPELKTLLVTGASQGASTINELITKLAGDCPQQFEGWQVLLLAGSQHEEVIKKEWSAIPVKSVIINFLQSMSLAWSVADVAVTRGGANTIAELAFHNVPAIVMPYPYHRDEHQRFNAVPIEHVGGVYIETDYKSLDENVACAGKRLLHLMQSDQDRKTMKESLIQLESINGSVTCAELLEKIVHAMQSQAAKR